MAANGNHRPELLQIVSLRRVLRARAVVRHGGAGRAAEGGAVVEAHHEPRRGHARQDDPVQDLHRILVKLLGALDEGPAVDVAHVRLALRAQEVEPAHVLLEEGGHLARDFLLVVGEQHWVAHLLALLVPKHLAVHGGGFARLGVRVQRPHRVHLDVRASCGQKVLVHVGSVCAHGVDVLLELGAAVALLAEQRFGASPHGDRVVDVDVVVLAAHRLLDKRLVEGHPVDHDGVVVLLETAVGKQVALLVAVHCHVGRHGDASVLQRLVHLTAIEEEVLALEVVHQEGLAQLGVRTRLVQREAHILLLRVESNHGLDHGPVLNGFVEDGFVIKNNNLKVARVLEPRDHLSHLLRPGLFAESANAKHNRLDTRSAFSGSQIGSSVDIL
mmetsp:Transcript_13170/g.25134  ORF Transcript_13170/g.25134 Transcript_13170/m.25134 type:complete len:386 (-) Transcript_13170:87-1244(-)